jgi:hypothetical protein
VIGMVATLALMVAAFAMVAFADTGVRFSFTVTQVLQRGNPRPRFGT